MTSLDDTQPNPVLRPETEADETHYPDGDYHDDDRAADDADYDDGPPGPGCFVWGMILVFGFGMALMIVILAGAAGWNEGEKEGERYELATQQSQVSANLNRLPTDLASGNEELIRRRLNLLETAAPNLVELPMIRATATALVSVHATATLGSVVNPVLTAIPGDVAAGDFSSLSNRLAYLRLIIPADPILAPLEATATQAALVAVEVTPDALAEATEIVIPTNTVGGFDLAALLSEANTAFAQARYEDAYALLDSVERIDANYERATVQGLLRQTLTAWAENLYLTSNVDNLAEAIRVTNLLEDTGTNLGSLDYERSIATRYLDVQSAIALRNHTLAIQRLNELRTFQTQYKGVDLNRLLFNEIVALGNERRDVNDHCQAVVYYNQSLQLFNDAGISGQRDLSQQLCEQGAQLTAQAATGAGTPTIEPVGQSGG